LKISGLIWLDEIIDKLNRKHHVNQREVVEIITNKPYFRFIEKGHRQDENVYAALGQTKTGRYLIVFFVYKKDGRAIILSARDMTPAERKRYEER
jgi:uncharacterized DUF497 family protein